MDNSLIDKHLYYKDLLLINSSALVNRYNKCLVSLGIKPTKLESFYIDSIGWSPEIAKEKNNIFYLGAGLPNPMAIILTPNQLTKPAYMSFNSYDKQVLDLFAKKYEQEIVDITTTHAIGIDIDDALIDYSSPLDLLLINYIVVRTDIAELSEFASNQLKLVEKFLQKPFGWMNEKVRADIIASAKKFGDIRYRRINISPFKVNVPEFFYACAFDGVFVMTNQKTNSKFLILESVNPELKKYIDNETIFSLEDERLLKILNQANLAEFNQNFWEKNLKKLAEIIKFLKIQIISNKMPELNLETISEPKLKNLLMSKEFEFDINVSILEHIYKEIEQKRKVDIKVFTPALKRTLATPNEKLESDYQIIIKQALCRNSLISPIEIYNIDRKLFLTMYESWNQNFKNYVVNHILRGMKC